MPPGRVLLTLAALVLWSYKQGSMLLACSPFLVSLPSRLEAS